MEIVTLSHISKSFGTNPILTDLNFSIPEHTIYGFIGQNGAGKTTTMKLILGLMKPDSGTITVKGEPVTYGQTKTNRYIGYLPDVPVFYSYMTPVEYLTLCGQITEMKTADIASRTNELLELVGLQEHAKKKIHGFSRGMKQRLGIAQALLNRPKLLICDEPTSALDPVGRKEILDILLAVKKHTTILFSTHILSDVERISDRIGFLHNGSLAFQGTINELRKMHHSNGFEIVFQNQQDCNRFLTKMPTGQPLGENELFYQEANKTSMLHAIHILNEEKLCPVRMEMREVTLENLFMEVIGK